MAETPKDAIDKLTRGKPTKTRVGSRAVPHHLYPFEKEQYKRALIKGYLVIDKNQRLNVFNVYRDLCMLEKRDYYVLEKDGEAARIFKSGELLGSFSLHEGKAKIKKLVR